MAMDTRQSTSPAAAMARTSAVWCLATRHSSSLQMLACADYRVDRRLLIPLRAA